MNAHATKVAPSPACATTRLRAARKPTKAPSPGCRCTPPTWTTSPRCAAPCMARPSCRTVAHGQLRSRGHQAALALPGVRDVILARDIPGDPMLAVFAGDEPVFAIDTVQHIGQVSAWWWPTAMMQARRAAAACQARHRAPLPAILTIKDALARKVMCCHRCLCAGAMRRGLAARRTPCAARWKSAARSIFTWKARWPTRCHRSKTSGWSTAAPNTPARCSTGWHTRWAWTATPCAWSAGAWAAALAARRPRPATWRCGRPWRPTSSCPVKLRLDRDDDFMVTGKRHPFCLRLHGGF
jgi:xanthine dehydrogenase large subunit